MFMKWYYWVIIMVILIVFLFPKPMTKGGLGGFLYGKNISVHKEELQCFGIPVTYQTVFCYHCGPKIMCHGLTYGKACYNKSYNSGVTLKEKKPCE